MDMINGIRAAVDPAGRSRSTKTVGLVATAVIALGLGLAGCGGSNDNSGGQSGASGAPAGNGGGAAAGGGDTKLVQYAQCMRKNGVPSFPDPVNGQLHIQVTKGGPMDPHNATFQSAQQACKSLQPAGLYGGNSQSSSQQEASLKFVQCMRKNGVPNFPDPQGGHFILGNGIDPNSPQFQKATSACRSLLPGGGAVAGGGGGQ
jgi:hypothetical protein